jgi:hypothetical protein
MQINTISSLLFLNVIFLTSCGYFLNEQNNLIVELTRLLIESQNSLVLLEKKLLDITTSSQFLSAAENSGTTASTNPNIALFIIKCAVFAACVTFVAGGAYYGFNTMITIILPAFTGKVIANLPADVHFTDLKGNEVLFKYLDSDMPYAAIKCVGHKHFSCSWDISAKILDLGTAPLCYPEIDSAAMVARWFAESM